jgi:hypothetical protein
MGADPNLRPKQEITAQNISGIYISFADLGIANGATIYGLVLFPNDVNASMNLISLTNVPTNTNQGSDGGLDLMAGMGYFAENSILPNLEWDFQLRKLNGKSLLNWNNIFGDQVKSFVVERSTNGELFTPIAEQKITVSMPELEFTDPQATQRDKTYYRIKAIQQNGAYLYSNTLFVTGTKDIQMSVYPNPFTHFIRAELSSDLNQQAKISWINSSGMKIKDDHRTVNRGFNQLQLNPPAHLPPGRYVVQIILEDGTGKTIQLIKKD